MNANGEKLQRSYNELVEFKLVLQKVQSVLCLSHKLLCVYYSNIMHNQERTMLAICCCHTFSLIVLLSGLSCYCALSTCIVIKNNY